jgi:hypothetical protein
MTKKLKKGNPITELVKGSLEYTLRWIDSQFRRQFPYLDGGPNFYVVDTFADYVTVESYSSELMPSEFYKVTYTKNGDQYTFAAKDEWEIVELGYQPKTTAAELAVSEGKVESGKKKRGKKLDETVVNAIQLVESEEAEKPNGPWRIKATGITADIINGNGRRYPASVLSAAVKELKNHLHESAGQGRMLSLTGESDHPADKGNRRPLLSETVFNWDRVDFDGSNILLEGNLLGTSKGKDIHALMRGGVIPGISQRGYGESKKVKVNDVQVDEITQLIITGYDATPPNEQSDPNGSINYFESQSSMEDDMNELLEQLKKLLAEQPELFNKGMTEAQLEELNEKQLKKLDESLRTALGIDANANIIESVKANAEKARKFDESQKQDEIKQAITEATKDLPFGKTLNEMFVAAMNEANLTSADQVKSFAESKRKEYSQLASKGMLKGMGFDEKNNRITVIGDVLETETGTPSFAKTSFELTESVRKYEMRSKRAIQERAESPAAVFTQILLERFDIVYKRQLMQEAQMFEEAELTTDLNLPYSVSRAIIEEAFPNLVAANIFDVGTMETSPTRLYFEATTGETGYAVDITDEVEVGGAEGTWYNLSHGVITPGTVVVTSNPAGTTYVEGTDYVINYHDGKIKFLTPGSIGTNDVLVDYSYSSIRNGEMAPIQRVKTSLSYKTIEAAADRLADQISREAIVFSRSQLGWDAVARTMANLVKQMRRKIDQGLLYMAFSAVKSVASNSTTAWTISTTDSDLGALYALLGNAAVIVAKRFYEPTFYLASITNTDRLSNWTGFKRDGYPQALLNAAGFTGMVKNRPVFASTEFPDTLWIVGNRELVQHRVFQPLSIKGPFPTYDVENSTAKLVAADQYYAEEFNATESTIPEKGAFVPVEAAAS